MSPDHSDTADVLVIGAGAAGAALTWSLARRGLDVLCLEQGDWVAQEEIPKNHADWEVRGRHYWNPSPGKRRLAADYPVTNLGENPVDVYTYSAVITPVPAQRGGRGLCASGTGRDHRSGHYHHEYEEQPMTRSLPLSPHWIDGAGHDGVPRRTDPVSDPALGRQTASIEAIGRSLRFRAAAKADSR